MFADEVLVAPDLPAALTELAAPQPTVVCAGGTDLVPRLRTGEVTAARVLLCPRLEELNRIHEDGGAVRIGAAVTYRRIGESALLAARAPALRELSACLANPRVRNRGTIGGHVCAARSRYDVLTLLTALDARAHLRSVRGERVVPVADVVLGHRRTALAPDELLVEIELPAATPDETGFDRVGTGQGPLVNVAVRLRADRTTVVVGGTEGPPIRLELSGLPPADVVAQVRTAAAGPGRGLASPWYRGQVAGTLTDRLLTRLRPEPETDR